METYIPVILALGILGVMGLIFGAVLSAADKKLAVHVDPRIQQIRDYLGGANCGACGYAGCDAFADAVVRGDAKPTGCPASGSDAAEQIGLVMGISVERSEKVVARVICQGTSGIAKDRYDYDGYRSCVVAASIAGGPKVCRFSCIGLGDCAQACAFGAINMENGIARIDEKKCVGCGNCIDKCPRSAIRLLPTDHKVLVLCRNSDTGRDARDACMKACIACSRCVKECQYDAIIVENGFARIDANKCTRCGACAKVCPCGCIVDFDAVE
ncbi:MAG: RnfABCDGE type electron transport complex subunit B [Clostridia bacterium]